MTDADRIAFAEIYKLWLGGSGKRERKTRRIIEEMLGASHCANIRAEHEATSSKNKIEA